MCRTVLAGVVGGGSDGFAESELADCHFDRAFVDKPRDVPLVLLADTDQRQLFGGGMLLRPVDGRVRVLDAHR